MPRGDRTGPEGAGPVTGRGLGYCTGHPAPGYMNPFPGRGMGRGFGYGKGMGMGMAFPRGRGARGMPPFRGYTPAQTPMAEPYPYAPSKEEELSMLKNQAEYFKSHLDEIQKRIETLEQEQSDHKEQ